MNAKLASLLNKALAAKADTPDAMSALIDRMARAADIQPDTVRQILRGDIETPPAHRLRGFAQVLGLRLADLTAAVDDGDAAALARAVTQGRGVALEIARAEGGADAAPEWVQLTPGPELAARDGRFWRLSDPAAVVAAFAANGADLPVDIEHATQIKGAAGDPAPAVGWIREIAERAGRIWARIDWTEAGRSLIATRAYRYISPAFAASKTTGEVLSIVSAGLTNTPALRLAALSREQSDPQHKGNQMDPSALAKALGLPETAAPAEIETAICALRASATQIDMTRFAPRADVEQALARAQAAEAELKALRDAALTAEIDAALDAAVEAGKIAPAARGFYVDACRAEGGLEKFRALVAASPAVVAPAVPAKKPDAGAPALSAEEVAVCAALGVSPVEFAKFKEEAA